jgi:hypothetical protein
VEVRKYLQRRVSLFSGQDFTVDASVGLVGICDFLITWSIEQLEVESPVIVLVEAKKADINSGMGQPATQGSEETSEQSVAVCMAEMEAARRFNEQAGEKASPIYGCVTSGLLWRFLKLDGNQMTVDLKDYSLDPLDDLLGKLVWMCGDFGFNIGTAK